jgi:hypothetical protein
MHVSSKLLLDIPDKIDNLLLDKNRPDDCFPSALYAGVTRQLHIEASEASNLPYFNLIHCIPIVLLITYSPSVRLLLSFSKMVSDPIYLPFIWFSSVITGG